MRPPERILVFELNWLGDILFSFPFLKALRRSFPEAYITCTVVPRYADLLINNEWINDVHVISDDRWVSSVGEKMAFVNMIRKEKYDICFFLKPSRIKTIMAFLAGIPRRVGFKGKKSPLTIEVDNPGWELHRADQLLALAGAIGIHEAEGTYEYPIGIEDEERAKEILHEARGGIQRMVIINPGGNWEAKKWPRENFTGLIRKLLAAFDDIEIIVTGGKQDMRTAQEMVSEAGSERCSSLAGRTRLNELAAIFRESTLMISADSGPLHLASAVGVTTIGLFGPTSHKLTGPRGRGDNIVIYKEIGCKVPCYKEECDKDYRCMRSITVEEVFAACENVLKEK